MSDFNNNILNHLNETSKNNLPKKNNLNLILETRERIAEASKNEITFSEPFLWLNGDAIFYPKTINVIQGKAGVHKSRLAETICAAILKAINCKNELLGFLVNQKLRYAICYVDTERNISDQVPFAVRGIKSLAGHDPAVSLENFDAISLLEIDRADRFEALEEYIHLMRGIYKEHLILVLDVITDCISSFNSPEDSMKLIDLMNRCINKHDVTFICLIHENPGTNSEKARGHLGTEITNKATTVVQVSFENEKDRNLTDIVKIHFVKCRNTRRHPPTYAYYSDIEKGLVLADQELIRETIDNKREKATLADVKKELKILLTGPMKKSDLLDHLMKAFSCSVKTIETRIKEILDNSIQIINMNGEPCKFVRDTESREAVYSLEPIAGRFDI